MEKDIRDRQAWERICKLLPDDMEATAHVTGAVKRKLRAFDSVQTLLRLFLVYSVSDWSFRVVSAWADAANVALVSDVALLGRLGAAQTWLAWLFVQQLRELGGCSATFWRFTVVLCDASTVNRPGKTGTDLRLHLVMSLTRLFMVQAEVTDNKGGETLARFDPEPGQLWVGDRGYGYRKGIWSVVKAGADVLVRIGWQAVHLLDAQGHTIDLLEAAKASEVGTPLEIPVTVGADPKQNIPAFPARLIIVRKTKEETQRAQEATRRRYSKLARVAKEKTFAACEYVFLLTTTTGDQLPAPTAAALYRLRWQIEICFKRQKSLLGLDQLLCRTDATAKAVLYAKLLAMVLLERICPLNDVFSLADAEAPMGTVAPRWRVQQVLWVGFKHALGMFLSLEAWMEALPRIMRRLREPSRKRAQARVEQWAAALAS